MIIAETVEAVLSFFFPARCAVCNERLKESEELLCDVCRQEIRWIDLPDCPVCGAGASKMPRSRGKPDFSHCPTCPSRKRPVYFDRCFSAVYYNDTAAEIVKNLKFNRLFSASTFMARLMFIRMQENFSPIKFDCIIPVPLHPRRQRLRGYNQAELIAEELSRLIHIPLATELLLRTRFTKKQTELTPEDRYFNVNDAFAVREPELLNDKKVLLIDDVYTTGSTLNSAAKALKLAGAKTVIAFTFAHS
ncbi:ComF family protein [Candidatus Sumerlaeota bacterium]|nr:ComF family protein [Candidatus Sumerlaeota bacterium]